MMRAAGGRLGRAVAGIPGALAGMVLYPGKGWAAAGDSGNAGGAVGTLPLLAALGIGIVVAVGAVIAFLQLTAKGKERRDFTGSEDDASPGYTESDCNAAADEQPWDERTLTDFTIPLRAMPSPLQGRSSDPDADPRLYGVGGQFEGESFRLNGSGLSIGRDPAVCHVVFPVEIGEVSRRHCTLRFDKESGLFVLEDHGSSNGTFLPDGKRLQPGKRYELRPGERFSLSGAFHWFEVRE